MDLRAAVTRWAVARPRVLLVDAPSSRLLRWRVEEELDRRGWPLVSSPADADLLLVLGTVGPELSAAVDLLWRQVPAPRYRRDLDRDEAPGDVLDAAGEALLDAARNGAADPPTGPWPEGREPDGAVMAGMDHGAGMAEMDHGGMDHGSGERMGMAEMEHGAHGQHGGGGGHEGHHMHHGGNVAGLAMAGTAPDRDGLELDSLQVSLGPVLPAWPTGLVLRGALQGDVLTGVQVSWADGQPAGTGDDGAPGILQSAALDSLSRFLVVAGWPTAARQARAARSGLRSPDPLVADRARHAASRLARRVRRSRSLAWSVRGIGATGDGDVLARVRQWCDLIEDGQTSQPAGAVTAADLASLVEGAELAAVRLVVASVDLEPASRPAPTEQVARA